MEDRKTHGGRRNGAGRPKGDSRIYSFRCPGTLAEQLDAKENRTEFIRESLTRMLSTESSDSSKPSIGTSMTPEAGALDKEKPGDEKLGDTPDKEKPGDEKLGGALGDAIPASRVKPMHVPFFDQTRVVAGFPIPLDNDERAQDIEILSMLCPHPEASYLIRVQGNSMIDAGILSGDIVIVDKSRRDPSPKEIAVCEINGEYTLKHFVREGGKAWLVPANPEFHRMEITNEDEFSIWGTVTYIIHKAREQK